MKTFIFLLAICAPALAYQQNRFELDEFDETLSIDEQVSAIQQDVFAMFTYAGWVMNSTMVGDVPTAVYFGPARLPYHRLDFGLYSEDLCGSIPTVVPDCGYEVWGSLFLIPVTDLDTVLQKGGMIDNRKAFRFVQKTAQVFVDGKSFYVKCNTFEQKELPEKLIYGLCLPQDRRPSRRILDMLIEAYTDGGLPSKYIEEISQLPIVEQDIIETNLTPVGVEDAAKESTSSEEGLGNETP